jgi:CheY-like chemotaxis protein
MSLPKEMGLRVLHAEDDEFVRLTLLLRTFAPLGIEYVQVIDGRAALDALASDTIAVAGTAKRPFDVIVLDNQMPRMSGAATSREMRARGYRGIIVGITGDPSGCDDRNEFEAAGLDACLDKDSGGLDELVALLCRHAVKLRNGLSR